MCVHIYVYMFVCMYVYMYVYTHTYTCVLYFQLESKYLYLVRCCPVHCHAEDLDNTYRKAGTT